MTVFDIKESAMDELSKIELQHQDALLDQTGGFTDFPLGELSKTQNLHLVGNMTESKKDQISMQATMPNMMFAAQNHGFVDQ